MNTLHLSRKCVWISTSAIGTDNQVSSLRDFADGRLSSARKLKHTVNKVLSLRDKSALSVCNENDVRPLYQKSLGNGYLEYGLFFAIDIKYK